MKRTAKIIGVCGVLLALLLVSTQPAKLSSVVLIVPFVLMFAILALTISTALAWQRDGMSFKLIRAGCTAAVLPIVLLVLQSVGQLTLRDGLTIAALFAITYFYMSKVNATVRP